ncbi:unnamed protein product [Adineta steineri]|uniref:G-protein coupled receptors family 1 profile domain-containing protein n=1 Tax=Adineta steineri TaxID=433720 RepID=A0A815SGY4_9BILA|nr:unnamed protein product [Adineta steineri]
MAAASSMEILATIQAIQTAEISLVRISSPILMIFGNIGEILNIIIFIQRTFRNNSCAIYFLAASCVRLIFINFTIFLNDLSIGYNIDPARTSMIFCKFKFYLTFLTAILPLSFIILACFDRLMLSSLSVRTRSWSQPRFAWRAIVCTSIFWIIFSIHAIIGTTIYTESGYSFCYIEQGTYTIFLTLYITIINYLLPPIIMTILGMLTIFNVRRTQRRVHSITTNHGYTHRKDLHLLHMLLFQVLGNVIFTIPTSVYEVLFLSI